MILDTDILIDILRGHSPAVHWFKRQTGQTFVSGIAAIELVYGVADSASLRQIRSFLTQFRIEWPNKDDMKVAYNLASFRLSHGVGGPDAITAAIALRTAMPVATFNTKHFRVIPNLQVIEPYTR